MAFRTPLSCLMLIAGLVCAAGCQSESGDRRSTTMPAEIVVRVVTPNGRPAANALAVCVPGGHSLDIADGRVTDEDPACIRSVAGPDGAIRIPFLTRPFAVVVLHPDGYCRLDQDEAARAGVVTLSPRCWVDGRVWRSGQAEASVDVSFTAVDIPGLDLPHVRAHNEVKTDGDGRFPKTRVPPGAVVASWKSRSGVEQSRYFEARPGVPVALSLGDDGRPATGAAILPAELRGRGSLQFSGTAVGPTPTASPPIPASIRRAPLARQQQWYGEFVGTKAGKAYLVERAAQNESMNRYPLTVAPDGTFSAEDLAPGTYTLYIAVKGTDLPKNPDGFVANAKSTFSVPDSGKGAVTVPAVHMEMYRPVDAPGVGEMAPGFRVKTLDGRQLDLSAFRGKVVLLDFWASWCGPCMGQVDNLKRLYLRHHDDERFVMIGMSLDDSPFTAKRVVDRLGIAWEQGFLGVGSEVERQYGVDEYGLPSFWLIAPDGRVIARPTTENTLQLWDAIDRKVESALVR